MAASTFLSSWNLARFVEGLSHELGIPEPCLFGLQMRFQVGDAVSFLWDTTFDLWHAAGEALSILWANLT